MTVSGSFIMIALALAQRMAMRITYGARGPQPDDPIYFALHLLNWLLLVGSVIAILGAQTWWLGIVVGVFLVGAIDEVLRAGRELQRQTTASLLSLAASRDLPLGTTLFRHATDQGGSVGRATQRLAYAIEEGIDLPQAVPRHRRAVPRAALAYVAVGDAVSDRPAALAEAARRTPPTLAGLYRLLVDRIGYLLMLSLFMAGVLVFMITKIVPEFSKMFAEFGMELPPTTRVLTLVSGVFVQFSGLAGFLLFPALLLLLVAGLLSLGDVNLFRFLGDRLLPGRHRAIILRSLALAAERNQPLDATIAALRAAYPSRYWKRRLRRVHERIRRGEVWTDALKDANVIRDSTHGLLRAGERVGNLAWTLRTAAERIESREAYRWTAGVQIAFPVLILTLAAMVGFICFALFVPLVTLVENLVPNV